jgi:hypothetical protein
LAAGKKSLGVYSLDEAERYFSKALEIIDSQTGAATDLEFADLVERFSYLLNLNTRAKEICGLIEKYLPRLEALGASPQLVMVLHHYHLALTTRAMYSSAQEINLRGFAAAEPLDDHRSRAYARASVILTSTTVAPLSLEAIEREGQLLLNDASRDPDGYIENWAPFVLAWDHMHRGEILRARGFADATLKNARERNDPRALGLGLWIIGWIDILDERHGEALEHAEEGLRASLLPLDRSANSQVKGIALILLGRLNEGLAVLTDLKEQLHRNGWLWNLAGTDLILSIALVMRGEFGSGIRKIDAYIAERDHDGYQAAADWGRIYLAEIYLELLAGKERPPLHVLLRNIIFLVLSLPFAARRALDLLERAKANDQFSRTGILAARIEYNLGLLNRIKKRPDLARNHLTGARRIAEPLNATPLVCKIDNALASL